MSKFARVYASPPLQFGGFPFLCSFPTFCCQFPQLKVKAAMPRPENPNPNGKNKKAKTLTKEQNLSLTLVACTKSGDVSGALSAFSAAVSSGVRPSANNFNSLLHLFSSQASLDPSLVDSAFNLFDQMLSYNISPSESTITSMARIACHKSDGGDLSFDLVKSMQEKFGIKPRLRTYIPCLKFFCEKLHAEKAYEVEEHMETVGVSPEESEISKLLEVSSKTGNGDKVYKYMHMLRRHVPAVVSATSEVIEGWFTSDNAIEVGCANWDEESAKETILNNGGGYYGEGWLGTGKWEVKRGRVEINGVCEGCGKKLRGVDLSEAEMQEFMEKVAGFALERETKANFSNFQAWMEAHSDYEAIIDAANVALYQQNFSDGGFSLSQLDAAMREVKNRCNGKWPLVVLHKRRIAALSENPLNQKLLESWKSVGALYTTPSGSNDDWYWLYATIRLKALLVTNDEMRDHIFELLGSSSFFPTWKERHQVKYTFKKGRVVLVMPPTYSSVMQESEEGSWHVPIGDNCEDERERNWLCISRSTSTNAVEAIDEDKINIELNGTSDRDKMNVEQNGASSDGDKMNVEQNGASSDGDKINTKQYETYFDGDKMNIEQNGTSDGDKVHIEQNGTSSDGDKINIEQNVTSFNGDKINIELNGTLIGKRKQSS